ncbi:glycosyltransferase family 2 protein [Paenibacillaceae bacterium WGS1546]|uniref:glycosyltransferase family 2 protein n=1 Tax=Cohnella sp. WGS1546 TaxID=3366810 RepID=UPI00372D1270
MAAKRARIGRIVRRRALRSARRKPGNGMPRRRKTVRRREVFQSPAYSDGFGDGYREGVQSGILSFPTLFEGTSIVIPTYNQEGLLKACIDSIMENTGLPYEIIVVDNASTDGTAKYLLELGGQVRYRVLESNRGFAGAVNVGMMMAKGRTILLLNNDTLVAGNWLDNLLACLNSDESIGMVGPMSNYISGDQKIDVPYTDIADMPKFAREFNRSDPARWLRTDRLTGFCLLFRRELFESVGYFDEGYEIGNFEDDDYNIRVRLTGKSLVMAQDTFVHHFGSVSMKTLGDRFQEVNDRNQNYFMEKWRNPYEWIHQARLHSGQSASGPNSSSFYPERVVVQGVGPNHFWIENGERRLIEGTLTFPPTKVSQIDMKRWPAGAPIGAEEVERKWRGLDADLLLNPDEENGVVRLDDGTPYVLENGKARPVVSNAAMQAWNLHLKPSRTIGEDQLADKERGLPVIGPPCLKQVL